MAEFLMMLCLSLGLSLALNKAISVLLRMIGFGLPEPSKKTVLLRPGLLRQASLSNKAPWTDLPPELLGLVLLRLPYHADQIRRAVCRQWRSSTRLQPLPPPLPWLALRDDRILILPDYSAFSRMPLPRDIAYRVSTGRMLFLVHRDGSCCLMNPFSRETTPQQINPEALDLNLCTYGSDQVRKVVVSDHIAAVLTRGKLNNKNVSIYTRGSPQGAGSCSTMEWAPPTIPECYVADIALFQGKLSVLTAKHDQGCQPPELYVLDVGDEHTNIRSNQCIGSTAREPCSTSSSASYRFSFLYLVACRDRLLMMNRKVDLNPVDSSPTGIHIEILEAVDLRSGSRGRWSKVDTLMGHALFVGPGCSESLVACRGGTGAQEDCVYFMTERIFSLHRERKPDDYFIDCIVYNMTDRTVEPLPLETAAAMSGFGPWHPTWVFPAII